MPVNSSGGNEKKMSGEKAAMVSVSRWTAEKVAGEAHRHGYKLRPATIRDGIANTNDPVSTGINSFNALGETRKDVQVQIATSGAVIATRSSPMGKSSHRWPGRPKAHL